MLQKVLIFNAATSGLNWIVDEFQKTLDGHGIWDANYKNLQTFPHA